MKFQIGIVTAVPEFAMRASHRALSRATGPIDLILWENGCHVPIAAAARGHVDQNVGVTAGLQGIYEMSDPDPESIIVYMHDDVEIDEIGWDARIARRFAANPQIGIVGFGGANYLGRDIHRGPFHSNMRRAERHGPRATHDFPAAAIDGFGFAVRRSLLDKIGGWTWWPLPHHGYDHGIVCMAKRHGMTTWACGIACEHLEFGTSSSRIYRDGIAAQQGGDASLYNRALATLQGMFQDVLPIEVSW